MIRYEILYDSKKAKEIAEIHVKTFQGFFLTFLGKGFLETYYKNVARHEKSDIILALDDDKIIGFLAYSCDVSGMYKFFIKKDIISFGWHAFCAFLKKPAILRKVLGAFNKSDETKRADSYIEIMSIGVLPEYKNQGIGKGLISKFFELTANSDAKYVMLETDANDNDAVNNFYVRNGFYLSRRYNTKEGREMNEYKKDLNERETNEDSYTD